MHFWLRVVPRRSPVGSPTVVLLVYKGPDVDAVGGYEPAAEAVVVQSIDDVIRVLIVRAEDAEDMGGIEFSATPTN